MKSFKDLGISSEQTTYVGEKLKGERILNCEIEVHSFKTEESKIFKGTICIHMQIKFRDEWRVLFVQGKKLLDVLERLQAEDFPFKTTIVKENECYEFT